MTSGAPLLLVRADADQATGTGHVMRSLAVAQAWRRAGGEVNVIARDLPRPLEQRLEREGCGVQRWADVEVGSVEDARRLRVLAARSRATALIVDGYRFGEPFRREIAGLAATTLLVHDYGVEEPLWLDFVLNQNPHSSPDLYPLVEPRRQLLGLRWAMLRTEFTEAIRPASQPAASRPDRVLVTLGGGDPYDLTTRVLRSLEYVDHPLEVRAVVGSASPHLAASRAAAARSRHQVRVLHNVTDMPRLMAWADVAVAAAGSTSWELAWMGVPWISVAFADNQRAILAELGRRHLALALGWHEDVDESRIAASVNTLIADPAARQEYRTRAMAAVDGCGAERVTALLQAQG
jgi:UDP-2,4-diacetamido-2,4,6-trideoxy-beta-L-altropyranose hydrolase